MTASMRLAFKLQSVEIREARANRRHETWRRSHPVVYTSEDLAWFRSPALER